MGFILLVLIVLSVLHTARAFSAVGFTPSLSASCSNSLSDLSLQLEPTDCGPTMSGVLLDSTKFTTCTSGTNGVNCFDIGSVMNAAESAKYLVPAYRLAPYSNCDLCTADSGMVGSCLPLLTALAQAVYGAPIDYSSFGITDPTTISNLDQTAQQVQTSCNSTSDQASTQVLQYQSQVLCGSSDTFGLPVSSSNNLQGILDMRAIMQCGTCGVLPCLAGQLCDGTGPAAMCPEGYYCPTTTEKIKCPKGSYCPEGSVEPKSCRGIASSSCEEEGSSREVAWVPLFFALLFIAGVIAADFVLRSNRKQTSKKSIEFTRLAKSSRPNFVVNSIPVSISFESIRLVTNNNVRLANVSGTIRPGKFTAILGGSGAGKTSLMNVILGREAKTAGKISYLSAEYPGSIPSILLDRVVAFVPQNDVYLREMTVFELVMHSALWRSPSSMTRPQVEERVEEVLTALQLSHLRDMAVGGLGQHSGSSLSPGDRKKVNIALELVADPNILFLDEPTTGIDASSALNVARIVSKLAHAGLTCVAVIHQPRGEIFSLIDDMIILVRGGRVAYQGPTELVLDYFAALGCVLADPKANKTDFLVDLTSKPPPEEVIVNTSGIQYAESAAVASAELEVLGHSGSDRSSVASADPRKVSDGTAKVTVQTWADVWEKHGDIFMAKATERVHQKKESKPDDDIDAAPASSRRTIVPLDRPRQGFLWQTYLNFKRGFLQHFKNSIYINDLLIHLLAGIIMGIVTSGGPLFVNVPPITYAGSCPPGAEIRCNSWVRFQIGPATFLMTMILGAVTIPGAVRCFGREKEVFAREAAVGANKLSYFLGKVLSDIPFLCVHVFIYLAPIIAIAPWQGPSDMMYGALFCIGLTVLSMGYWLSFVFADPDAAVLTGVILAILLNLFSGFVPTIGDGPIGLIMYTHWAARAICSTELWFGQGLNSVTDYNNVVPEGWADPDYSMDILGMLIIASLLLCTSYFNMLYNNRRVAKME